MIALLFLVVVLLLGLVVTVYLLGFRLGGDSWLEQLTKVRSEAAQAQRRMQDLTRQAFVAMTEEAQRHRRGDGGGPVQRRP